jgi:hypothetical protein
LSLIEELNLNEDNRNKRLASQAEAKVVHLEEKDEKKKMVKDILSLLSVYI